CRCLHAVPPRRSSDLSLPPKDAENLAKSGPWTDLGLTLPIFVGYHLGVVFLPMRNAADVVTRELVTLANDSLLAYGGLTLAIGRSEEHTSELQSRENL